MQVFWFQGAIFAVSLIIVIVLAIKRFRNDDRKDFENRSN
jgi:hypothetical protein